MANYNKEIYLRGKVKYFKLLGRGDMEYQCWSTVLYLTKESYATFLELKKGTETTEGIQNEIKMDDEGHYVNLRRVWTRKIRGNDVAQTPPVVIDKDGIPWNPDISVGQGSDATIKLELYTFKPPFKVKRGSAIRLVSARIESLVPYEPKKDLTEFEEEMTKGLIDQKSIQYF